MVFSLFPVIQIRLYEDPYEETGLSLMLLHTQKRRYEYDFEKRLETRLSGVGKEPRQSPASQLAGLSAGAPLGGTTKHL